MTLPAFLIVVGIGFSVAAAVGPISILTIQRTLQRGWRIGLASGLGVAAADGLYGLVGGMGLSVITEALVDHQTILRLVGGAVLLALGLRTFFSKQEYRPAAERSPAAGYVSASSSIFLLTLSNPMTILSFASIYVGVAEFDTTGSWWSGALFGLAIFTGSFLWWLLLVSVADRLRSRFKPVALGWLNRISGVVIAVFGMVILFKVLFP